MKFGKEAKEAREKRAHAQRKKAEEYSLSLSSLNLYAISKGKKKISHSAGTLQNSTGCTCGESQSRLNSRRCLTPWLRSAFLSLSIDVFYVSFGINIKRNSRCELFFTLERAHARLQTLKTRSSCWRCRVSAQVCKGALSSHVSFVPLTSAASPTTVSPVPKAAQQQPPPPPKLPPVAPSPPHVHSPVAASPPPAPAPAADVDLLSFDDSVPFTLPSVPTGDHLPLLTYSPCRCYVLCLLTSNVRTDGDDVLT